MRKMAYCNDCRKRRRITVKVLVFRIFYPFDGACIYDPIGEPGEIQCDECGSDDVQLTDAERDELTRAAVV